MWTGRGLKIARSGVCTALQFPVPLCKLKNVTEESGYINWNEIELYWYGVGNILDVNKL